MRWEAALLLWLVLAATRAGAAAEPTDAPELADDWVVRTWQTEDGLPQNSVYALLQTRDGSLWVGTQGGVARFDGMRFRTFGLLDGLKSVSISALAEDSSGALWVGTRGGGVSRWQDGRFQTFSKADGLPSTMVEALAADDHGTVYIGTDLGLLAWHNGVFRRLGAAEGLPEEHIRALLLDSRGVLWVSVILKGLFRGSQTGFAPLPVATPRPERAYSLFEDRQGAVWVGDGGTLWQFQQGVWTHYGRTNGGPTGVVECMAQGREGPIWVGARDSDLHYFVAGTFHRLAPSSASPVNDVRTLVVDREGVVWAGTIAQGLSRVSRKRLNVWGTEAGLPPRAVTSIAEDATGGLWVTLQGSGLYRLQEGQFTNATDSVLPANIYGYTTLATSDGSVWAAGEQCLYRLRAGQKTEAYTKPPIRGEAIRALCADGQALWLGTYYSTLLKLDGGEVRVVATNGSFGGGITSLAREAADTLWIGTLDGLYRWDHGQVRPWTAADGLLCSNIQALEREPDGTLWIGTQGGGLARLKRGRIVHITTREGLVDDVVTQVLADENGHLWLGCNRGIMRLEKQEIEDFSEGKSTFVPAMLIGQADGMPKEQCTGGHSPTALKTRSGRLLFPTVGGIVDIDPRRFEAPSVTMPHASIEELLVDGQRRNPRAAVVVPPGTHRLEVNYTAPSLAGANWVRFRYRLEPTDKGWSYAGTRRTVSYADLPPGDYVFRVSASNNRGAWTEAAAALAFSVQPLFWQTWWFRAGTGLLLVVLGGALAWSWSRRRIALAVERERQAHELHVLRGELARVSRVSAMGQLASALAHELNQPLSAILRNAEAAELLLKEEVLDVIELRAIVSDIVADDQRAGGVIDRMRAFLKHRTVEHTDVEMAGLLQEVLGLTRPDALRRKVEVSLQVAPDLPTVRGDRIHLQQVLLNLLLNGMDAMEAQPPGTRRLVVQARRLERRGVEVRVQDSGPGIRAQNLSRVFEAFYTTKSNGMGMGLAVSKTIIEAHQGAIWAENRPEGGACFCFTVPLAERSK